MATSATNIYTINRATLLSSKVNLFPAKIETFLWLDNLNLLKQKKKKKEALCMDYDSNVMKLEWYLRFW